MVKQMKIRESIESLVDSVAIAIFLILFLIGGYALVDAGMVDNSAAVDEEVMSIASQQQESPSFDFSELKAINPEIIAWLEIEGTNLNYPVLQTNNNSKYLVRDYRGEYSTSGAIFVDSRNDQLLDDFTIIYGHRMDGSKMFGEIANFSEKAFFDDHVAGVLYTEEGTYDLRVLAYSVLNIGTTTLYRLDDNRNDHNAAILEEALANARARRDGFSHETKLIMLSTCDKDSKHYRDVLLLSATKRGSAAAPSTPLAPGD